MLPVSQCERGQHSQNSQYALGSTKLTKFKLISHMATFTVECPNQALFDCFVQLYDENLDSALSHQKSHAKEPWDRVKYKDLWEQKFAFYKNDLFAVSSVTISLNFCFWMCHFHFDECVWPKGMKIFEPRHECIIYKNDENTLTAWWVSDIQNRWMSSNRKSQ